MVDLIVTVVIGVCLGLIALLALNQTFLPGIFSFDKGGEDEDPYFHEYESGECIWTFPNAGGRQMPVRSFDEREKRATFWNYSQVMPNGDRVFLPLEPVQLGVNLRPLSANGSKWECSLSFEEMGIDFHDFLKFRAVPLPRLDWGVAMNEARSFADRNDAETMAKFAAEEKGKLSMKSISEQNKIQASNFELFADALGKAVGAITAKQSQDRKGG